MFCNFAKNFENSKWPPFFARKFFFENWHGYSFFFFFFFFLYKCSFIATIRTCHYTDLEVHTPWQGGVPVIVTFKYLHIKIQEIYTKPQKVEYILQNFHKINFK